MDQGILFPPPPLHRPVDLFSSAIEAPYINIMQVKVLCVQKPFIQRDAKYINGQDLLDIQYVGGTQGIRVYFEIYIDIYWSLARNIQMEKDCYLSI